MNDEYRALHTHNIIESYGKSERIPAQSNKVPKVIIKENSVEWIVKGLIFNKTTKFIYDPNINSSSDDRTYRQVNNPRVTLQIFGKNLATNAVVANWLDEFGNNTVDYWYNLSLVDSLN